MDDLQLRLLIAEKVMGWVRTGEKDHTRPRHRELSAGGFTTVYDDWDAKGPHPRLVSPDGSQTYFFCNCGSTQNDSDSGLPDWLNDLSLVEQILERLEILAPEGRMRSIEIKRYSRSMDQLFKHSCLIIDRDNCFNNAGLYSGVDEQLTRAICKAALKACGVEIPD